VGRERLAEQEVHREKRDRPALSHVLAEVVQAADVGVRDLPRDEDLPLQAGDHLGVGRDLRGDRLEGHVHLEREVLGFVDLAHASAREEPHDAVAIREEDLEIE